MKFDNYGYQPLWFYHNYGPIWRESFERLEIAVHQATCPSYTSKARNAPNASNAMQAALEHMLTQPEKWWCYQELATDLNSSAERMRARVRRLLDKGLVTTKMEHSIAWVRPVTLDND